MAATHNHGAFKRETMADIEAKYPSRKAAPETAWLIEVEAPSLAGTPFYLCVTETQGGGVRLYWRTGADRALRFARQQDAQAFIAAVPSLTTVGQAVAFVHGGIVVLPRASEHIWDGSSPDRVVDYGKEGHFGLPTH